MISQWNWWDGCFLGKRTDARGSLDHRIFVDSDYVELRVVLKVGNWDLNNTVGVWSLIENLEWRNTQEILQIFNCVFASGTTTYTSTLFTQPSNLIHTSPPISLFVHFRVLDFGIAVIRSFLEMLITCGGVPDKLLFHQ